MKVKSINDHARRLLKAGKAYEAAQYLCTHGYPLSHAVWFAGKVLGW